MSGGNISDNNAVYSGGVCVYYSTFNMNGGDISNNNATIVGGGIIVDGTFNMTGSATIDSSNDVYMNFSRFITVTGDLGIGAGALNITTRDTSGTVIRYNSGISLGTWTDNFALNQTWASEHPLLALGQSGNDILLGTNCTVNFSRDDTSLYLSQYNVSGALLAQPAYPTKLGYTFNGWNITNASGTPWDFTNDRVTANLDLYANWTKNPTPTPTTSGGGGNTGYNTDAGATSPDGTFTTDDGGLILQYPAGSSIIVTVFPNDLGGATAPSDVSYLTVYDVHSTAVSGTSVNLEFRVNASELENKGLNPEDISILHYFDGEWYSMMIKSIELVNGEYQFAVSSTHTSPFMVAYNVDVSSFPLEVDATPTSTPTTGPAVVEPTVVVPTTTPTETPSSPVPIIGIIAGLGAVALLIRRE